eukprot:CAMPEP_0184012082 /NCGR_PEP_ID=MMETSP0954-20121128/4189_1 /TAXON_ID=627963 /ORGANISM="Aplanochytrium sp, Strain PBS07" /LENGTH=481 /DNA_ID=CAMNT_0026291979 /DNA_START=310 /DNA_END=1755 /DNA_ORIENTATION=-
MNAMGSNINIQTRGTDLMRIVPRTNDDINEEWIDDKTRFAYDGLKRQRLTQPLVRDSENPAQWDSTMSNWRDALNRVKSSAFSGNTKPSMRAIVGPSIDLHSAVALSDWVAGASSNSPFLETLGSVAVSNDLPNHFRFGTTFAGVEESDLALLVGTNLEVDCPLLIARMRKPYLADQLSIFSIGYHNNLRFPVQQLGLTADVLVEVAEGRHPFCAQLATAAKPMIFIDASVFERSDGPTLAGAVEAIAEFSNLRQVDEEGNITWNGVNVIHRNSNDVGLLELGRTEAFAPEKCADKVDFLYLSNVGADDLPVSVQELRESANFIVYQGTHGDELAAAADVVLPSCAYSEKSGVYVNMEGRVQQGRFALAGPGLARDDWKIVRALSEVCPGEALPYDDEDQMQERLEQLLPSASSKGYVEQSQMIPENNWQLTKVMSRGRVNKTPFTPVNYDFHLQGHAVARASQTMAKCSQNLSETRSNFA